MKNIMLILLYSTSIHAIELKFIGPCDEVPLMKVTVFEWYANVGELTIGALEKYQIPYLGTAQGLASAFGTPTGRGAIEIVSNEEIRAYGWCYSVDGIAPEVYPHELAITEETKQITWHFGFARFLRGQWITQCTPAYSVKPEFLCKNTL